MGGRSRWLVALVLLAVALLVRHGGGRPGALARAAVTYALNAETPLPAPVAAAVRRLHLALPVKAPTASPPVGPPHLPAAFVWPLVGPTARAGDTLVIEAPAGAPARAVATGRVTAVTVGAGGSTVTLAAGDAVVTYAGLGSVDVRAGSRVTAGQVLGVLRHTGPGLPSALRLTVRVRGRPVDPVSLLEGRGQPSPAR